MIESFWLSERCEGFNLGSLGGRIGLPGGIGSGLVLVESHHKASD